MGKAGECIAIGTYVGVDAINGFYYIIDNPKISPTQYIRYQNNLMCYFGDRNELSSKELKVIKDLGLKFRGKNEWIYFRAFETGYVPYILDERQVVQLTFVFQQLYMALKHFVEGKIKVDFESGNILKRQYASTMQGNEMKSYLINEDGIVFSSSDTVIVDGKADYDLIDILKYPNRQTMIKNGETYITFQKKILSNGLTLVNLVPRRYIVNQALKELPVFILISISLCAILLFLGFFGSYKSTTFIKDLTNSMNRLKGKDYDVRMPHYQSYSADILSDSFNGMIQSMKTLINDTYKSKILLQEMELEFIQQQINPHFLFNVLATIQIKAKMCSDETVYEMLTSLSGLLRASICSDKNVMVTLEQEFKYVQYYLYIQKQRYTDKLDYSIKIDDSLKQIRLPRLTIEPIVENCVIHGYDNLQNNVKISIEVLDGGDDAYIVISDNGKGFDVRELDLDGEEITNEDSHEKIGLKNTNNRLKIRYGNDYALKISSKIGKGTEVVIRIRKNIDKPILL